MHIKQTKIFFLCFRARYGLTLLLRISIEDEKSGLHSSFVENWLFVVDIFFILKILYF